MLRSRIDEKAYHVRVGCRLHTSYLPARLWWFRERDAGSSARCAAGCRSASTSVSASSASSARATRWRRGPACSTSSDPPILDVLGLAPERLGPIVDLDRPFRRLRPEFAGRWPALARVPWYPALGDGACSNVGAGCITPARAALMVGTSGLTAESVAIPEGL